jgi:hypothetical protein
MSFALDERLEKATCRSRALLMNDALAPRREGVVELPDLEPEDLTACPR